MSDYDLSDLISEEDLKQFRIDAQENLDTLEESLLHLEENSGDLELIGRVFRVMHTIKGTASMYGYEDASAFTHHIESYYDLVRSGKAALTREVIDLTLNARDQLAAMVLSGGQGVDRERVEQIQAAFSALAGSARAAPAAPAGQVAANAPGGLHLHTIRFRFHEDDPVFRRAINPQVYLNALLERGEGTVTCHLDRLPPLEALDVGVCHLSWDVTLTADCTEDDLRGEFLFIEDELAELSIIRNDPPEAEYEEAAEPPKLGEILVKRGDLSPQALEEALEHKPKLGETLIQEGKVAPSKVKAALQQQAMQRSLSESARKDTAISSLRVSSEKLDDLVNQVGELVIAQARLRRIIEIGEENPELLAVAEDISRLTENLRDGAMGIRMLPISTIFTRFNRLVRDLSQELGKEIDLVTQGGETELDKTVIENLNDPLVHVLRNSLDHGIEPPEARRRSGKNPRGTIRLSAIHSGANVLIRIEDDGQGLDVDRILAKARAKGLVEPHAELNQQEAFNLIFAPGFSTADSVTNVSGRGVGMDVVKKSIDALRGEITVQSSRGKGTVLNIKLPLTLAIIDGFLVQSSGEQFVLPLSTVKECVKLTRDDVENAHGRQIINIRNEIIPYVRLRDIFHLDGGAVAKEQVVITEVDRSRIGMVVDQVIGQSQVVIKSLGDIFRHVAEFSGATILGDGKVVPILDVGRIIETAKQTAKQ